MKKRGVRPKGKVKIKWSPNFAYAIGLLATDGCLSKNGRHITFVSKDKEQLQNFMKSLNISVSVGYSKSGDYDKLIPRIQFSDVLFYKFLVSIGITPAKSKTIGVIKIPPKYFFDFLRGHLDGDGTFYSYWDSRWRSSFMFYLEFISASKKHIDWLRKEIKEKVGINGHITTGGAKSATYQLKYAKGESLKLLPKMYYNGRIPCLSRKRDKIQKAICIDKNARRW